LATTWCCEHVPEESADLAYLDPLIACIQLILDMTLTCHPGESRGQARGYSLRVI